jgi:ribonuclease D
MSKQSVTILHQEDLPANLEFKGAVAIDTETMGLNLARDRLCLIQLKDETDTVHLVQFKAGSTYNAPNLKALLANENILKIFHYARFDVSAIYIYLGVLCKNIFCTKIASKLCRTYTSYHGLKELARELLSIDIPKIQQTSDWGSSVLTADQQTYAASDVLHLHALKNILEDKLKREHRLDVAKECFKFLPTRATLDILGWDDEKDIFMH